FDVLTQGTLINSVTANPYPLTGLSSSTSYDWYVLSVTGAGSSTWAGPATFRTAQIPATLPLTEGWESGQGSWAFENGTETNAWYVGTVDPFAGTASAYVSNDNGVSNAYTITTTSVAHIYRDISFGADNLNFPLSFQWRNAGESTWDRMRVYLVDTSVTPVAGTELTTGQVGLTNYSVQPTWTTGSITLPGTLSGSVKRLVFSWKNDGSGGTQPPINLDNISLTAVPVPSGPVLAPNLDYPANRQLNLAKTGFPFQFSWNMAGTEPDVYNLYIANVADLNEGYDSDEFFGAATFFEDVTSPYTPVMSYAYGATYVWTVAGFNAAYPDEVYLWPPNEFTIEPDPAIVSFPHTQNFDDATVPALPTGWSSINVNADAVNWGSYATSPYSAPNCASIGYNGSLALNDWMVSPALSLQAGTTYALDFKYRGGSTSYVEKLKVMLGSGNQVADLTTQIFINENINFADYTSANATFTVPSTGNYYLGWHAYSDANQLRIYVDDITIRIPAPLPPLAATVSFPQSGSTTLLNPMLKWTPSTAGEPATSFKVYLNQGGAFTESHVVYTGAATQFQTTGLVNGLSYSWKVVPSNANGSTVTCPTWTFNTPGLTQLAEGFEAATFPPMGWANGSSGSWSRSTSTPLFEGTASAYKFTSTSLVYDLSTPLLTIVAGSKIDFYTRASATSQVMQVVYSTDRLTWTQIGTDITYPAINIWYPISINLSSLAGSDYYIGFRTPTHTSTGSIYVDHVIGPNIVPVRPDPVTQSAPADAAQNQVRRPTLTWTSPSTGGVPTGYKILCDASATPITPTTQVALATGSPYIFEADLNWGTTYYWSVVPTNSVGDASPNTVRSFTVMDDPTIYVTPSTPYLQAFGTVPPAGWSRYNGLYGTELTTTTSGWTTDDFVNLTTPVNPSARLNVYGTTTKYWLVTAPISIPATGYELKMDIGLTTYSGIQIAPTPGAQADDKFIVAISDSPTMTNPTILREWNNSGSAYVYDTISPTGENQSIDLSPYAGTKYIAFYGESTVSGGDNNIYVDNVKIWLPVANDLAATLVAGPGIGVAGTQLTYNVTVVNNGTAPQSSYNVYLKKFGAERLATLAVNTPLAAGATAVHTITWTPATAGTYSIVGESGLTGDMAAGNNESAAISTSVYPIGTYMPMVGNIASTTSTYMYPINVYYKNSLNETIYLGHELQASSGTINAIILQNNFTQNVTKPIKLWMKHTTESNLTAAHLPFTGYQLVFDGDVYFPMGVNAVVINLTTPFVYTGGNLAVRTYAEWESTYSNNTNVFYYTASPEYPNRTRYVYVDGDGAYDPITLTPYPGSYPTTGTVSNIPNTAFVMNPATPITTLAAPVATVVKTGTNAVLNWAAIPGAFAYRVYASDDP
ncbi:MAG: choice-of-anchor J domain-containing protein, partial [Candidatus Cloacimonetes bacterium]|nr:choice-of-anchor J domain-containing protein [Candidatus Cloacimonadota bacterium]